MPLNLPRGKRIVAATHNPGKARELAALLEGRFEVIAAGSLGLAEPEETEALEVIRLPFWEAVDRVKRGEIRDLVSVAALLRIALMSAQGELPDPVDKLLWG